MNRQETLLSFSLREWLLGVVLTTTVIFTSDCVGSVRSDVPSCRVLPDFIYTVRAYAGAGYNDFQISSIKELGLEYVQGLVDFTWDHIERGDDVWKWVATDAQMNQLAQAGLKVIAFVICPKSPGLPWDETITRDTTRFVAEYGEFAYEVVNRYHKHSAWSGLVAVWGGSSDVFGEHPFHAPEVQVPLLNAAYDGIKRADANTIVISFNLSTSISTAEQWQDWFGRTFAMSRGTAILAVISWAGSPCHLRPAHLPYAGDLLRQPRGLCRRHRIA